MRTGRQYRKKPLNSFRYPVIFQRRKDFATDLGGSLSDYRTYGKIMSEIRTTQAREEKSDNSTISTTKTIITIRTPNFTMLTGDRIFLPDQVKDLKTNTSSFLRVENFYSEDHRKEYLTIVCSSGSDVGLVSKQDNLFLCVKWSNHLAFSLESLENVPVLSSAEVIFYSNLGAVDAFCNLPDLDWIINNETDQTVYPFLLANTEIESLKFELEGVETGANLIYDNKIKVFSGFNLPNLAVEAGVTKQIKVIV